ncbi:MAG: DinB family protein [Vicinamibacterales bacterium]
MPTLPANLETLIVRDLEAFVREVERCPADRLWTTLPGVTNAVGNLALHVAGNLRHFVGTVLGGTGFVRHRDDEFGRRSGDPAGVVADLRETIAVVRSVLPTLRDEVLAADYPEAPGGQPINTALFLQHLCAHLAMHLGQAGYLRRILTAENVSAGPMGLKELARSEGA